MKVSVIPLAAVLILLFAALWTPGAAQASRYCAAGERDCNGCVKVQTDVNNCGKCGTKCIAPPNASAKCYNFKCEYICNAGWKNCDGNWVNGCETDVSKDVNNCGGCKTKCSPAAYATPKCNNNKCEYTCKAGWANCDNDWKNGCESATGTDVNHCGGCGRKCPEPMYYGGEARCNKGQCEKQSCKKGMKYNGAKKSCVHEDGVNKVGEHDGGEKDGDKDSHKGDDKDGHKGDDKDGHKKGDDKDGHKKGDDKDGHKKGDDKDGHKGDDKDGQKGDDKDGHKKGDDNGGYKGGR